MQHALMFRCGWSVLSIWSMLADDAHTIQMAVTDVRVYVRTMLLMYVFGAAASLYRPGDNLPCTYSLSNCVIQEHRARSGVGGVQWVQQVSRQIPWERVRKASH